jgi:chromosome segregation protein
MPLETALEAEPVSDRVATEDRAHRLRKQISNLGPVNPIAMEEFEALQARREFMTSQIQDLESSRKALHKVLAAIDRKMRDRFLETFEDVDRSFQEIFSLLFPGGAAQLQLTEPDDPDTTGVEIIAQPRGKKLAKMSLMSGGEKSLTALALLFAVYRTRPCPFYILDEVEAALDDTNLRRFVAFADSMRTQTQFIVVTHQRRTMEMADVLYGVSMQADGVSKIVSQKLDRTDTAVKAKDEHAVV